ncbi:glycoside hydrolase family 16 protein [Frondihabitans peucedani]|uniref:GH16 domain-containing protein n=1 Tax=Frondihabitans peucedani TaxID=598626 RepID=A0ABP8DZP7_9MICO
MPSRRSFLSFFGASAAGAAFFGWRHRWHAPQTGIAAPTPAATASATARPSAVPSAAATVAPVAEPAAEATATATTASLIGSKMPTGTIVSNGTTWTQVYAEDFLTNAPLGGVTRVYPKLNFYASGKDTSGYGTYAPNQVLSVKDSALDFHLHSVNGQHLVASVVPDNYAPHVHARVSIRYRADPITGYKFVGMLWPKSDNWNEGEIDWPEGDLTRHPRPASAIAGTLGQGKGGAPVFLPPTEMFANTDQSQFHVATTEWTSSAVRFYWDGALVAEVTRGIPTTPLRVTLQAETWIAQGAPSNSSDGHIQIDWITIHEAR